LILLKSTFFSSFDIHTHFPTMIRSLLASLALATAAQAAQTPNIVFIFCDDLTCQAISAYGDKRKLLETPNMDRIAKEGMRFDRCLVTNSICGPDARRDSDGQVLARQRLLQQQQQQVRQQRSRPSRNCCKRAATRPPSSANGTS
jgi:hypothetical protein